jgi:hypothetical protein
MQNRNNTIEERLQIINDYIQRTMDALNATRQVVQGLSSTNVQQGFVNQTPGISHSSFVGAPQFVQTPWGVVAVNQQQLSPFNYGVGYGFNHSQLVPQTWPMNVSQLGVQQVLPQLGYNYGWQGGLGHTQFVPSQFVPQQLVPQQIMPQQIWNNGLSHTQFVPQVQGAFGIPILQWPLQNTIGTWGVNHQVAPQGVVGQTL